MLVVGNAESWCSFIKHEKHISQFKNEKRISQFKQEKHISRFKLPRLPNHEIYFPLLMKLYSPLLTKPLPCAPILLFNCKMSETLYTTNKPFLSIA